MENETKNRLVDQFLNGTRISKGLSEIKRNFSDDKLEFVWVDETLSAFIEAMQVEWGEKLNFGFYRMDYKYDPDTRSMQNKIKTAVTKWNVIIAPKNNTSALFVPFTIHIRREIEDTENYALSDDWELWIDCWNDIPVKINLKDESKYSSSLAVEILRSLNNIQFISQLKKCIFHNDFKDLALCESCGEFH